jgi:hypothetical protein
VCRGVGKDQDVSGSLDHRDQVERGALSGEAARITLTRSRAPRSRQPRRVRRDLELVQPENQGSLQPIRSVPGLKIRQYRSATLLAFRAHLLYEELDLHFIAEQCGPARHARARQAPGNERQILEQVYALVRGIDVRRGLGGGREPLSLETLCGHNSQGRTTSRHDERGETKDVTKCACDREIVWPHEHRERTAGGSLAERWDARQCR